MIFSTPLFVFGFLPIFLMVYYILPQRLRPWVILTGSCIFYGWWKAQFLAVVLGLSITSFVAARFAVAAATPGQRHWAVRLGVGLNLATLGYFKYTYFLTDNFNPMWEKLGQQSLTLPTIILPIGISFLTFQSISYIIDVARGDAPPARSLVEFLSFSTLFPQLIAGPVLRYKDLAEQFVYRAHSLEIFARGLSRFVTGLAMKLLIADSVAPLADRMFTLSQPTLAESWLGALAFSIQLLFDFAGYSAMAIGLGLMIGFRYVENFNSPYISRSITEFWRRWHISLSNWLRDYLYVPLGGNRGGPLKTYRNIVLTMVLGGFWHGANWTFFLWGCWHGGLMAFERWLGVKSRGTIWPGPLAWAITMLLVMIGWVMFRAPNVADALQIYGGMIGLNGFGLRAESQFLTQPTEYIALAVGALLSTLGPALQRFLLSPLTSLSAMRPIALFCLCVLVMNARLNSPFLYFQF